MAATTIIETTNIDSGWLQLSPGENRGVYLVAIKGKKTIADAMSIDELKSVIVEIGIDSGISGHPITIQRCAFRFNEKWGDAALDGVAALSQTSMLPKTGAFIKVVAFSDGFNEIKAGKMPISINMMAI